MNLEEYYSTQEKASELTQYIHENYKLIMTKMLSEMRRKLDIDTGTNEYYTLMVGLMSRFFHELTMAMAGVCQSVGVQGSDFIHPDSLKIFLDVYEGKDVLNGRIRSDVKEDLAGFKKYYLENIDQLRECEEALPK